MWVMRVLELNELFCIITPLVWVTLFQKELTKFEINTYKQRRCNIGDVALQISS